MSCLVAKAKVNFYFYKNGVNIHLVFFSEFSTSGRGQTFAIMLPIIDPNWVRNTTTMIEKNINDNNKIDKYFVLSE